jgi:general secretion pathway protein L
MKIAEALNSLLARLRMRYARTPLPRFFAWWGQELVALLPARWRAMLAERAEVLLLAIEGDELVLWRQTGEPSSERLGRVALTEPAAAQRAAFDAACRALESPDPFCFLCIPAERTLRRRITLPVAAEDNLRQVLAFEMDRQTPFKADQVYFDYRVAERGSADRSLQVEFTVVPRAQLDAELGKLSASGIALDGVDCWQAGPGSVRAGLNLLPLERRRKRKNLQMRLNLALAGAALVLLVTGMVLSLDNRAAALAAMTAEVEQAQREARQVSQLRKTLQDTIDAANFLSRKKRETPLMVEFLNELSERLPEDTYLERLNVDDKNKIELQGLSNDASRLIALLQKSEVLVNPSVQGTIQPDPRIKKDRFNITLEFRKVVEAASAKAREHDGRKAAGGRNAPDAGTP